MMKTLISIVVIVTTIFLLFSFALAQKEPSLGAKVIIRTGEIVILKDISTTTGGGTIIDARWKGGTTKLRLVDMAIMEFDTCDKNRVDVKVYFKNGRTDVFNISCGMIFGQAEFGKWNIWLGEVGRIEFFPSGTTTTGVATPELAKVDRLELKNGDVVTGSIINSNFTVNTSYADVTFQREQISEISLEGSGQNIESVVLKVGDKLSGIVQFLAIDIQLQTGSMAKIEKEKIRRIVFKSGRN